MEMSARKRKLNELDKNIPLISGSASQLHTLKGNALTNKVHKVITPSKGSENITPCGAKAPDGFENLQSQKVNDGKPNKSEGRGHMKSCDRRYRRMMSERKKDENEKSDLLRDAIRSRHPDKPIMDLSKMNATVNSQITKDMTLETHAREIKMWFANDYLEDIVACEFEKESQRKLSSDFCKKYDVDAFTREDLVDWLINVQVQLKATNNTLHLAVNLLDNLLDKLYIPKDTLAASAIASFWVAYKFMHGNLSVKPLMNLLAAKSSVETILCQEVLVLQSSQLLQAGGDLSTFFNYLLIKLFGFSFPPEIYYCGQYFLEIMLVQFTFVSLTAPEKAITAVYAALYIFDWKIRFRLLEFENFIQKDKLQVMCGELMLYLRVLYSSRNTMRKSHLHAKYASPRYLRISNHDILRGFGNLG